MSGGKYTASRFYYRVFYLALVLGFTFLTTSVNRMELVRHQMQNLRQSSDSEVMQHDSNQSLEEKDTLPKHVRHPEDHAKVEVITKNTAASEDSIERGTWNILDADELERERHDQKILGLERRRRKSRGRDKLFFKFDPEN